MAGVAKKRHGFGKRIKDSTDETSKLHGIIRRLDTPVSIQSSVTGQGSGGGSSTGGGVSGGPFLPTAGGTMIGAIAFFPKLVTISTGSIDIGRDTDNFTTRIIIYPESGTTDDLDTIAGAEHAGQLLFIQGILGNTITIKNETGNIRSLDGVDFTLVDNDVIILMFDSTSNQWVQITSGRNIPAGLPHLDGNGATKIIENTTDSTKSLYFNLANLSANSDVTFFLTNTSTNDPDIYFDTQTSSGTINVAMSKTLNTFTGQNHFHNKVVLGNSSSHDLEVGARITTSLLPKNDDSINLGASSQTWENAYIKYNKEQWFDASALKTPTTNPATSGSRIVSETPIDFMAYDDTTSQSASLIWHPPQNWDPSMFDNDWFWKFYWTTTGGTASAAQTAKFKCVIIGLTDGESLGTDSTVGASTITDTWHADDDMHVSDWSALFAHTSSPLKDQPLRIKIIRDVTDTISGDVQLLGFKLKYTVQRLGADARS